MKSLAACEMSVNSSASKSNSADVTFDNVSSSVSPANGDRPDSLHIHTDTRQSYTANFAPGPGWAQLTTSTCCMVIIAELNLIVICTVVFVVFYTAYEYISCAMGLTT